MVIDPRRKRFVVNMQLRQCFARVKPIWLKISQKNPEFSGFFISKKSQRCSKNNQNFKIWFQKKQIGNPATQELRMRIKYARKLNFLVMYRCPENLVFLFPCWDISNSWMLLWWKLLFWARATVLSCYRIWSCSQHGQCLRWSAIADKIKTIISDTIAMHWRW